MKHRRAKPAVSLGTLLVLLLPSLFGPSVPVVGATTLVVVSTADSGPGTLRQAILDAKAGDTITFDPSVFPPGSPATIYVRSALPPLTQNGVIIDASNAGVILDGSQAPPGTYGLAIEADLCVIRGLTIQRFGWDGIRIEPGADGNTIGGDRRVGAGPSGQGNLIILNQASGISIRGGANLVRGNYIGVDGSGTLDRGNALNGIALWWGATANIIGGTSPGYRNVIGGNDHNGVWIGGEDTCRNEVIGNFIGTNADGTAPVGNTHDGIRADGSTHDNRIEGNVLSGNGSNGIVISGGAHHNVVYGNLIGTDRTGTFAVGGQPGGGIDLSTGAHHNTVGGPSAAERNVIGGNGIDGIFIQGQETQYNTVQGNYIGTDVSGTKPIPNTWGIWVLGAGPNNLITGNLISHNTRQGIEVSDSAQGGKIISNTISHNGAEGIHFAGSSLSLHRVTGNVITGNGGAGVGIDNGCRRITISGNSVFSNTGKGIEVKNPCVAPPKITGVALGASEVITGTAAPNVRVEIFSDDEDEGQVYEGYATSDGTGRFVFSKAGGFAGPNITATGTNANGDTSEFSQPVHLAWTFLLYLNGDNDLEEFMFDTLANAVAAGPSSRANVLMLVDGYTNTATYSGTVLYDVTWGQATPITVTFNATMTVPGELNMGDGRTLVEFTRWGRAHYPARYTLLAIVDHGGGWSLAGEFGGGMAHHHRWFAGGNGLSWDFSSDYDYLDSNEVRQALAEITDYGADPLDVVFYDVCLMGMIEVAYQIREYASFFVSSQNIGWASLGPGGRYVRTIQELEPTVTPRQMAEFLVETYADTLPPQGHPFTISAIDLAALPGVADAASQLATAISQTLTTPGQVALLHTVYSETQKLDYDSDFYIEPASDGFVDLYDFASRASRRFGEAQIVTAAQAVTTALEVAVVAERHRSGIPWVATDRIWNLDNVHGLSIFLPLGEDLELPILITETSPITPGLVITRNVRLRDMYSRDQLQFVNDTAWKGLIDAYYEVVSTPVPTSTTEGPVEGPLMPDVTPPQTAITVTGTFAVGEMITVTWSATDTQTSVAGVVIWRYRPPAPWMIVRVQPGASGVFTSTLTLAQGCTNGFAVRAFDGAGNVEQWSGANTALIMVEPCVCLPLVSKNYPP